MPMVAGVLLILAGWCSASVGTAVLVGPAIRLSEARGTVPGRR